jgi:uncharacterized SAM-dependent methyltransferase
MVYLAPQPEQALPETEWLEHDLKEMFRGNRTGVGLKYLYQNWHQLLEDDSYYVDKEDRELIDKNKAELASIIGKGRPLVELGCGGSDKGVILAEAFRASKYVGVDFWFNNAQASANLSRSIPSEPLQIDFMRSSYDWAKFEGAVLVVLGSTISNLVAHCDLVRADEVLKATLNKLLEIAGPEGDVIVTYDTSETAEKTYNTPEHIAFRKGIFAIANEATNGTHLNPDYFDAPAIWDCENRFLSHNIVANTAHTTLIGGDKTPINFGQAFIEGKSYKFSRQIFDNAVRDVKAKTVFVDQTKNMVIQHITRHP